MCSQKKGNKLHQYNLLYTAYYNNSLDTCIFSDLVSIQICFLQDSLTKIYC